MFDVGAGMILRSGHGRLEIVTVRDIFTELMTSGKGQREREGELKKEIRSSPVVTLCAWIYLEKREREREKTTVPEKRFSRYFIRHKNTVSLEDGLAKLDYDLRFLVVVPSATKYLRLETARRRPLKARRVVGRPLFVNGSPRRTRGISGCCNNLDPRTPGRMALSREIMRRA